MTAPALTNGSETWALAQLGKHWMTLLRIVQVYILWDQIWNEELRANLNNYAMAEKFEEGTENRIERNKTMSDGRPLEQVFKYLTRWTSDVARSRQHGGNNVGTDIEWRQRQRNIIIRQPVYIITYSNRDLFKNNFT